MYRKRKQGWWKHVDFILLDILCLQAAFIISYMIRFGVSNPYQDQDYMNLAMFYVLIDFCVAVIFNSFKNILKRGYGKELIAVFKHVILVEGAVLFWLFSIKNSAVYSRLFFYQIIPLYAVLTYIVRVLWKNKLGSRRFRNADRSMLIIVPREDLEECIENICHTNFNSGYHMGAVVIDADLKGQTINNVPVVANYGEVISYISREWVDEVFLSNQSNHQQLMELIETLNMMGVVTHLEIAKAGDIKGNKQQLERIGNYSVLTSGLNYATPMQLFLKRSMDIVGGLIGCLITILLTVVFGPVIYFSSPGPIFFTQERVGRNGKKFKMYKFRTMYLDAEERKKELMDQNRVDSGMMFKLDYDPRIIGNKILPDGTIKEGIGSFMRKTSLDEFPQMFNILKGDMSLVGTRPPTVDEWEKYEPHHRARLAFRPGLSGLWQVSGRSNITDFEEVVKLDTRYIDEWSLGLDIRILIKTVQVVFGSEGAM